MDGCWGLVAGTNDRSSDRAMDGITMPCLASEACGAVGRESNLVQAETDARLALFRHGADCGMVSGRKAGSCGLGA